MAKIGFAIVFLIVAIVLLGNIIGAFRHPDKKGKQIRGIMGIACATSFLYFCALISNSRLALSVVSSIAFAAAVWMLFFFYCFTCEYTKYSSRIFQVIKVVFFVLALADNGMLLLLMWTRQAFQLEEVGAAGEVYLRLSREFSFFYHVAVSYLLGVLIICMLIYRASQVPKTYRISYFSIAVALLAIIIVNAVFLFVNSSIDFSIILYAAAGILLEFYIYQFVPWTNEKQVQSCVIENMTNPLLLFGYDDTLQLYNNSAREKLSIYPEMELKEFLKQYELTTMYNGEHSKKEKSREFSMVIHLDKRIYLIQGTAMRDEQGDFLGTLFLYNDITHEEELKDEATYQVTHDQLTGLWNSEYFFEVAARTLEEYPEEEFLMIASDVAKFKLFNEILGRKNGNDLLQSMARAFEQFAAPDKVFGRISGDRFALLWPKSEFQEKQFINYCEQVVEQRGYSMTVYNYIGVYEIVDRRLDVEQMYDRAYMAAESIKGNLQKRIAYYKDELRREQIANALTIEELLQAVNEEQFIIYLQPQVDSVTGNVVGCEALARWQSEKRGLVSPGEFIPLFEANGMITKLDYYIWEKACQLLQKWNQEGREDMSISINISSKDFYMVDLFKSITELVEKYQIRPEQLKLEITESAIMLDVEKQMKLVKKLQKYGFLIEMDDFGSGYSSLNSLKNISVDILKLDMKFFGDSSNAVRSEKIIDSMVRLAYSLKMPVIAEGVETDEQLALLHRVNCAIVQGYYYAKPMSILDYEDFLDGRKCVDMKSFIHKME